MARTEDAQCTHYGLFTFGAHAPDHANPIGEIWQTKQGAITSCTKLACDKITEKSKLMFWGNPIAQTRRQSICNNSLQEFALKPVATNFAHLCV